MTGYLKQYCEARMEELSELCSTQAVNVQNGTLDKCDFLRQVARFIIFNRDHLPDDIRLSLFDAFGKRNKSSSTRSSRLRADNARGRIEQAKEIDIIPSPEILTSIAKVGESPISFWTAELSVELDWDANILRHIYRGNRQNDKLAVTYRAFYTTATYLFIRSICKAFNVTTLTDRVIRYCAALVDQHGEKIDEEVKVNLKNDYKAGLIWNTYAEKLGGYGAFFLIGVAPTWVKGVFTEHKRFEISLNQSDDLRFAVSHFKSIKVPQTAAQYSLHEVGSKIISEVTQHVGSSLPQQRPIRKGKHKIHKPPKSGRSKSARIGASTKALERAEDRLASSENRALQDDNSSVYAERNQAQEMFVPSCLSSQDPDSSHQRVPESHYDIAPVHISQASPDRIAPSQQTLGPLQLSARSSPNHSVPLSPSSLFESAEQAIDSGIGSSGSTSSVCEIAVSDATTSDSQGAGNLSNQVAAAEQPFQLKDLHFETAAHESHPTAQIANAQMETSTPQVQAFSNYSPLDTINGTDNNISIQQNRPSTALPPNFFNPHSSAYLPTNTCFHSSQSHEPGTSTSGHSTPTCYQNMSNALTPNYGGLAQAIHSQQSAGPVHSGFLDVSQAFQDFCVHNGFDDTTQAMNSHAGSSDVSGITYSAGMGLNRPYHVGSLQGMDQVSGVDDTDSRIRLDGYHSVSQAVEPLLLYSFANANSVIQDGRYISG